MKRHPKINKCSTMFIPDSRVVNWCDGTVIFGAKIQN